MRTDRRALIIGIENYKNFPIVDYALNDAELISETLKEYQCQFSSELLLDENATANEILKRYRKMLIDADDNAMIIFFFAGHGITVDNTTFLVTTDTEFDEITPGLYLPRLIDQINIIRKPNQSCVFFLDCCHAGAMPIEDCNLDFNILERNFSSSGVALIAATASDQNAYPNEKVKQGVFTNWLFNGLTGAAANSEGQVTIFSLYDYISKAMDQNNFQKPTIKVNAIGRPLILGEEFTPRSEILISNLSDSKWFEIESTSNNEMKILNNNLEVSIQEWKERCYRDTCCKLSNFISWRIELENKYSELKNHEGFRHFDRDIFRIQIQLSNIQKGTNLENGKVLEEIGSGGFGTVYKVQIGSEIQAYKVYHSNHLHEYSKLKSFRRGYKAMKMLDYPNIIHVKSQTNAPEGFYMQFIDGPNFREWWTGDLDEMLNLLHIISQALEYAHNQGVVHRDIKPENIIIDNRDYQNPVPYLTDFDLAWFSTGTVFSTIGSPVSIFGHYLYAAPEQYDKPDSEITRKPTTDVYGFGQLCFYAICKSDPERDKSASICTLQSRISTWPNANAAYKFVAMYEKCIRRSPSERYQSMDEVSAEILDIRNSILDPENLKELESDEFIKELIFSLFGFDREVKHIFNSRSTRTMINIQKIVKDNIQIKFDVIQGYTTIAGTFETQRNTINRRIDEVVLDFNNRCEYLFKRQREDIADTYCTRIDVSGKILTLKGVSICRSLILEILNCIEQ